MALFLQHIQHHPHRSRWGGHDSNTLLYPLVSRLDHAKDCFFRRHRDNSTKALADSSRILSPSLYVAIHDPTLLLQQALEANYTRLVLVNANGMTSINLGLSSREVLGQAPAYDYQLSISTIPAMDLPCGVGKPGSWPCFIDIIFQFPTFDTKLSRYKFVLETVELVGYIGSWFTLAQLFGWIASGLSYSP